MSNQIGKEVREVGHAVKMAAKDGKLTKEEAGEIIDEIADLIPAILTGAFPALPYAAYLGQGLKIVVESVARHLRGDASHADLEEATGKFVSLIRERRDSGTA